MTKPHGWQPLFPVVETDRLTLRPFEESDVASVSFYADPDVMRYIPRGAEDPAKIAERFARILEISRERWATFGFGMWAVVLKESGRLIGHCGLQKLPDAEEIELFYLIDKPYWNQGIATEAAKAALRFGFDSAGLERIIAIAMPGNIGSQRVMEKAGMRYEGRAHHYDLDCVKYSLSRGERLDASR